VAFTDPFDNQRQSSVDESDVNKGGDSWQRVAGEPVQSFVLQVTVPRLSQVTEFVQSHAAMTSQQIGPQDIQTALNPGSRGNQRQLTSSATLKPYPIVNTPSLHCENDQLVFYAIPPGMLAWRNKGEGSWMISYLYQKLCNHDFRRPLNMLSLLTKVSAEMSFRTTDIPKTELHKKMAISVIEHKLTKDVLFTRKERKPHSEKCHPDFFL